MTFFFFFYSSSRLQTLFHVQGSAEHLFAPINSYGEGHRTSRVMDTLLSFSSLPGVT